MNSQKRAVEGGKQGASLKKLKKDKVVGSTGKAVRTEVNTVSAAPRVKAELTLPVMYVQNQRFRFPVLFFYFNYLCTYL